MNLKTATPETLADLCLPDEALAALAAGQEWEYTPDDASCGDADVWYCDDCHTYHLTWNVWGLRLDADGILYETFYSVDTDGDWEPVTEIPYGEFDHRQEYGENLRRWRAYAEYVVRTGHDPVKEFTNVEAAQRFLASND